MKFSKAVGIDLGTTNSVIAMVGRDNETIVCRTDRSGRRTFPSVVAYDRRSNDFQAGAPAFAKRGTAADPVVSIKSHMGDAEFRAVTGPKSLSPIEVSAIILREMKRQMQEYLEANGYADHVVDRAVITVPAYFASNAREATTAAAEAAGLEVAFTLQEPTAAVLYYTQREGIENGIFLVYDLGGGTFDVSVVQVNGGDVVVLGIAGNNYLGGDNFDEALAQFLVEDLRDDVDMGYDLDGFDPVHDPEDARRFTKLKLVAESIKKSLSLKREHYEEFSNIFADKSGASVNLALEVTRETFESLIRPTLESTIHEVERALERAHADFQVTLPMVDAVLLVGGSTHIPLVNDIIVQHFTDPSLPEHTKQAVPLRYEPDMAVGYGAAVAAASTGVRTLDDLAYHLMTDASAEPLGEEELVVAPTFGPGYGTDGEATVEGTLKALHGTLPSVVYARVTRASGGYKKDFAVSPDGTFAFRDLPSDHDPEPYACEFLVQEEPIARATFDAAIRNAPQASVTLSRTYFLEALDADGATQQVELMRQGQTLPISRDYKFRTNPNNSYFVVLRFFEETDFLKQITVNFPEPVAPGTEVKLSLSCSQQSRFSARAEVAGIVVDTQFEPSPPAALPGREEIDSAVSSARAKITNILEPGKRIVMTKRLDRLVNELDAALDENDSVKARTKLHEIGRLVSDIPGPKPPLTPPRAEFERLARECQGLYRASGQDPAIGADLEAAIEEGRSAYANEARAANDEQGKATHSANKDQERLTTAHKQLRVILELLKPPPPVPETPLWKVVSDNAGSVIAMIDAAMSRDDLPESFRRDHLVDAEQDRRAVREAMRACTKPTAWMPNTWMSDEEAAPHLATVQKVYRRWLSIAQLSGTVELL